MGKRVIILFGPPGAGKGTQAELLADKLDLYYLETSKILEETFRAAEKLSPTSPKASLKIKGEKYSILQEKEIWEDGILCSPPFVVFLVKKKIEELHKFGKNVILAGSPRTLYEGKELVPFLKKRYGTKNIKVIFLAISVKETIFRNSHRRICTLMRHPVLYNKETAKLSMCPLDGSKLIRRKELDDLDTITVRLKEYKKRTFPLLAYFRKQDITVKKIHGSQSVVEVFRDALKAND